MLCDVRSLVSALWQVVVRGDIPWVRPGYYAHWLRASVRSLGALRKLKRVAEGETVFCLGNGPSLLDQDLSVLSGATALLTNNGYRIQGRIGEGRHIAVISDVLRLQQIAKALNDRNVPLVCTVNVFDAEILTRRVQGTGVALMPRHNWVRVGNCVRPIVDHRDGFADDLRSGVWVGCSVIFTAIQLAAYMGAARIVLAGVDMDYSGACGGQFFASDIQHVWQEFDYETNARSNFLLHRDVLASRGIELLNATRGGRLDVLRRLTLEEVRRGGGNATG